MSLKRKSHTRWFLQISRQMVLLTCSYQHAIDAPNAIGGQTRLGATLRIMCCAPSSPFGTAKYGCHDSLLLKNSPRNTNKRRS